MKIKTWLLLTYLLVMLIPLAAFYGLYVSINNYYQDKHVEEYFDKWNTVTDVKKQLTDPSLYSTSANYAALEQTTNNYLMITLYNASGRVLYASNPFVSQANFENKKKLYQHLYELEQTYDAFVYKEPVYQEKQIIGIYKISLARTEWVDHVESKMTLVLIGLAAILLILYSLVIWFLHRRLNKPLRQLQQQMQHFAKGLLIEPLPSRKDEIGELSTSFEAMQQEILAARAHLQQEQQQKHYMLASLSHDLKTPLTSIQAYTESLLSEGDANKEEYLSIITAKTVYMKQLLDELTMFSLLQSPTYEMELVAVDGEEFFDMLLADYEDISREKGFICTISCHVTGTFYVQPKQLMRVLDNLLSNAWRYTNTSGTIRIAAFNPHLAPNWCSMHLTKTTGVYIIVTNTGTEIPAEQLNQIFEPLYQVDQARTKTGNRGTGLGLTIAKDIIEKHHGTIKVVSKQNETAFIIWLPQEEKE